MAGGLVPGPPPKPAGTRARRNATVATTTLPANGRGGRKAPPWPLRTDTSALLKKAIADETVERLRGQLNETEDRRSVRRLERELDVALATSGAIEAELGEQAGMEAELWDELWSTPQAAMWEKLAWSREVAQYVRWKIRGELGDLDAAKEARQWSDRLGLNPLAMLRLRWEIERTDAAEAEGRQRRRAAKPPAKKAGGRKVDPRRVLHAVS